MVFNVSRHYLIANPHPFSFPYLIPFSNSLSPLGGFPCLRAVFQLERNYGYHLITTYVPSAFIVTVSWVGFWIAPDAVPGRVTLGVTTVLTIITQSFIGGLSMPQVRFVKNKMVGVLCRGSNSDSRKKNSLFNVDKKRIYSNIKSHFVYFLLAFEK